MKNALHFTWVIISMFLIAVDLLIFGWYVTWPGDDKIIEILVPIFGSCIFLLTIYSIVQTKNYFKG